MKNKPADDFYIDVSYSNLDMTLPQTKKIKTARPILDEDVWNTFIYYIKERYHIHVLKDVKKLPKPWTKDNILKTYRFTNVRREHDKETKWLIEHIVKNSSLSYEDKLLNCILFRMFNKHETAEILNMPIVFNEAYDPENYRERLEQKAKQDPEYTFFTQAFSTSGQKLGAACYTPGGLKERNMIIRMLYLAQHLASEGIAEGIGQSSDGYYVNPYNIISLLSSYKGIGEFLSYQIFVDFTYIPEFPYSENEYVIAGPGCRSGLGYLFRNTDGMTDEECLFWIRNNWDKLIIQYKNDWKPEEIFVDLPKEEQKMNIMSLENCFCELSKYIRAKEHKGRPRTKYNGFKERLI